MPYIPTNGSAGTIPKLQGEPHSTTWQPSVPYVSSLDTLSGSAWCANWLPVVERNPLSAPECSLLPYIRCRTAQFARRRRTAIGRQRAAAKLWWTRRTLYPGGQYIRRLQLQVANVAVTSAPIRLPFDLFARKKQKPVLLFGCGRLRRCNLHYSKPTENFLYVVAPLASSRGWGKWGNCPAQPGPDSILRFA